MSVTVRKHKRGWIQVDIGYRLADGSKRRERLKAPCTSINAAKQWGERIAANRAIHGLPKPKKEVPHVEQFASRFVEDYAQANRLKPSGIAHKKTYLRLYVVPLLGKMRLDEISNGDVQRLKASMQGRSAKTVNNALTVLSKMLKVAVEWGVIETMPVTIRLLKPEHTEMQFYEEEDYRRLVDGAAKADARALITVLLGGEAGLRRSEITALEWSDVDFQRGLLNVSKAEWKGHIGTPKGGRPRTIPMSASLSAALKAHRHLKGSRVLYSNDGSQADRDALASWVKRAERRAGLKESGRLHILRHTFCSRLAMRGATVMEIKELAGHANLSTTLRYMHLSPSAKHDAIRLLDAPVPARLCGNSLATAAQEVPRN